MDPPQDQQPAVAAVDEPVFPFKVRPGKELTKEAREHLIYQHLAISWVVNKHLSRAADDIGSRVHSFLPKIPPVFNCATGSEFVLFTSTDAEDVEEGSTRSLNVYDSTFAAQKKSSFWINAPKCLAKCQLLSDDILPDAAAIDANRPRRPHIVARVRIQQVIPVQDLLSYLPLESGTWRQFLPNDFLHEDGGWRLTPAYTARYPSDKPYDTGVRALVSPCRTNEKLLYFVKIDNIWFCYCLGAPAEGDVGWWAGRGRFRTALTTVDANDVAILDFGKDRYERGTEFILYPNEDDDGEVDSTILSDVANSAL